MSAVFEELEFVIRELRSQIIAAERALEFPRQYARKIETIEISTRYHCNPDEMAKRIAGEIRDGTVRKLLEDGRADRDRFRAKSAAEIESLRAVLPGLAARACIELGTIARQFAAPIKEESNASLPS